MKARYQYRFYPSDQQKTMLAQLFGYVRVVWNDALSICKKSEKLPKNGDLQKSVITQAKKTVERQWLSEVSNIPLQQSVRDLGTAYSNYFNSLKGNQKGRKVNSPKFKKKTNRQTARFRKGGFSIKNQQIYLAKIGNINPIWSRSLPTEPSSVTVIKDCANRYFVSFVVEIEPIEITTIRDAIGIDLGLKTFAVMSNGDKALSPIYSKYEKKIRRLQKKLARQEKDSKRRNNTRLKIAKLHNRITDTRKDFLHKLSTKITNENQVVVLEDLNVSGMMKNRKLSRAISIQGWYEFKTLCENKSTRLNRDFRVINRWEPTSQVCSSCGFRWGKLDLSVRTVVCLNCGTEHDRDQNASINIEKVGLGHCHDSKWTWRQHKTITVAAVNEVSRITDPKGSVSMSILLIDE